MAVLITRETAREYNRRSLEAKRLRAVAREKAIQDLTQKHVTAAQSDDFTNRRLLRVRKQLNMIDDAIDDELRKDDGPDGQRIDRLASASARLSEIERQLADRPLPGSRRPAPEKPSSRPSAAVPIIPPAQ